MNDDARFLLNPRTYENRLSQSFLVLWKQWKRFRYYPILDKDFDELLQTLSLEQYINIEFSSYKFFKEHSQLMRRYDIRDEYELHNLLKKIYQNKADSNIKFKKMPTIEFGTADKDEQVLNLLLQFAPISNIELADKYEEIYGVRAESVLANHLKSFESYFHNGIYSIDAPILSFGKIERMKDVLKEEFYTINEVKRIYLREFPKADIHKINAYTLKEIGFKVYSDYVVKNKYLNATNFFREILTNNDIVNISEFPKGLLSTLAFTSELAKLKSTYEIIEFSSYKYINIRKLTSVGITKETLLKYIINVEQFVNTGEYFTILSLRNEGFKSELDYLGFDDCFYGSILAENNEIFSYRRMGRTKVFVKGNYDVTVKSVITYIINIKEKMDIYELIDLLKKEYDIKIDKERIIHQIRDSTLYYNEIMETVYINYDIYFEEI